MFFAFPVNIIAHHSIFGASCFTNGFRVFPKALSALIRNNITMSGRPEIIVNKIFIAENEVPVVNFAPINARGIDRVIGTEYLTESAVFTA